eukprot:2412968-Rhodomonas_salina.2
MAKRPADMGTLWDQMGAAVLMVLKRWLLVFDFAAKSLPSVQPLLSEGSELLLSPGTSTPDVGIGHRVANA